MDDGVLLGVGGGSVGVTVGVGVGVDGGCTESEHISIIVPAKPPGPVTVKVVNGLEFEIVNVPPPSLVPGKIGQ